MDKVLIIDVTKNNFEKFWPKIIEDISNSSFLAIDAEMSGLGSTKMTMNPNLDERYASLSSMAATRSIISLGLACFNCTNDEIQRIDTNQNTLNYSVSIYNIMLLSSDPYMIDPAAVKFLVNHGFNFNKQFSEGISFYAGNDRDNIKDPSISMRRLFCELIRHRKPLVLHNGLTDLVFMYQCFYAQCPSKLTAFMADLSEIFPSGIYDTKYIAEFLDHTPASFLLFLFKFNLLKNKELLENGKISIKVDFGKKNEDATVICLHQNSEKADSVPICNKYAEYGWCLQGFQCKKSHDIDAIVQMHRNITPRKRKRKSKTPSESSEKISHLSYTTVAADQSDSTITNDSRANDKVLKKVDTLKTVSVSEDYSSNGNQQCPYSLAEGKSRGFDCNASDELTNDVELSPKDLNGSSNKGQGCNVDKNAQLDNCTGKIITTSSGGHRSGIDAFMTGYIFAVFIASRCENVFVPDSAIKSTDFSDSIKYLRSDVRKSVVNKLFLSGKSIPLPVCKSKFTKTSKNHNHKILKVYLK